MHTCQLSIAIMKPFFPVFADSGGVICAAVEYHQGSETHALATIEEKIRVNVPTNLNRTGCGR